MQDGSSKGPIIIPIVGDRGFQGDPGAPGAQVSDSLSLLIDHLAQSELFQNLNFLRNTSLHENEPLGMISLFEFSLVAVLQEAFADFVLSIWQTG